MTKDEIVKINDIINVLTECVDKKEVLSHYEIDSLLYACQTQLREVWLDYGKFE